MLLYKERAKKEEDNFRHNKKELEKLLEKEKTLDSTLDSESAQFIQKSNLVDSVSVVLILFRKRVR